jgi:hypothetical protein
MRSGERLAEVEPGDRRAVAVVTTVAFTAH